MFEYVASTITKEKLDQIAMNSIDLAVIAILEKVVGAFYRIGIDNALLDITDYKSIHEQYEQVFYKIEMNVLSSTSQLILYANILTNDIVLMFKMDIDGEKKHFLIFKHELIQYIFNLLNINRVVEYIEYVTILTNNYHEDGVEYKFELSKGFKDRNIKIKYFSCKKVELCFDSLEYRDFLFYTVDLLKQMTDEINEILDQYYKQQEIK